MTDIGKYRKKPVVIEAVQWTGENLREIIAFTDGPPETSSPHAGMMWEQYELLVAEKGLIIVTLEGQHLATVGDWIIKGVKGEHYPCKPDVFEMTYEAANARADAALDPAALEDKLAKAVDWLETIRDRAKGDDMVHTYYLDALAAIAAIKGESHE